MVIFIHSFFFYRRSISGNRALLGNMANPNPSVRGTATVRSVSTSRPEMSSRRSIGNEMSSRRNGSLTPAMKESTAKAALQDNNNTNNIFELQRKHDAISYHIYIPLC